MVDLSPVETGIDLTPLSPPGGFTTEAIESLFMYALVLSSPSPRDLRFLKAARAETRAE